MSLATTALRATVLLATTCLVLAVVTVWLVLTDPVSVVTVVNSGDLTSLLDLLTRVTAQAFQAVARYF